MPFIWNATLPPQWECRVCSEPAGTDPLDPPPKVASYLGGKSHLGHVKSRRSPAEGDALMAESLARRDHPEEFNVWAAPRQTEGLILPPRRSYGVVAIPETGSA